jgi:hypothetical protein
MLRLSKYEKKRKKAIAIITAQVLFHIDPNIDSHQDVKELARILENQTEPVGTACGWTTGNEVAKLILEEGLDTVEFKSRILRYKGRRHLSEKKKVTTLKTIFLIIYPSIARSQKPMMGLWIRFNFFQI